MTFNAMGMPVGLCIPCKTTLLEPRPIISLENSNVIKSKLMKEFEIKLVPYFDFFVDKSKRFRVIFDVYAISIDCHIIFDKYIAVRYETLLMRIGDFN